MQSLIAREFENILIVKPSSLGDVIHALPVLHALRRRYPRATIRWLVATPFAPLLRGHPDLDDVVLFDRKHYSRFGRSGRATVDFLRFARDLRRFRFDLVLELQGLFRSGLLARITGAPVRIGFASAREFGWAFCNHRVRVPDPDMHAADKNYLVGQRLGFDDSPLRFDLAVKEDERVAAAQTLSVAGLGLSQPFATVWPGARWETKRWAPARFAKLISRIKYEHNLCTVLMGDATEAPLCEQIAEESGVGPIVLAGKSGLRQAVAIVERATVVVAHDSAPMHMAAALGRPLVAILGPTHRDRTGPYGMSDSVIQADLPCSPCYLKQLVRCPYHHQCMADITVDDVVRAVGAALGLARPAGERESGRTGCAHREFA